jgi:hypothetical protein
MALGHRSACSSEQVTRCPSFSQTTSISRMAIGGRLARLARFMVEALETDDLIHEASAIVGRQSPSALALAHAEA